MDDDDPRGALAALAALGDPLRRRLYRFVSGQDHAVGRDEAAQGVGVSRSAAAFHLDRLVYDGLLEAEFRRLTGRQGPGAGRPAKLSRRARRDIALSLPVRRYDLAAGLLASAVAESTATGTPADAALRRLAQQRGAAIAGGLTGHPRRRTRAAVAQAVADALGAEGYEPRLGPSDVTLGNCPFSALAADHPELMCGMNLALLEGFAAALPDAGITPRLRPAPDACCVRLEFSRP